ASRLVTADEISVVVPNSQLATAAFRNYSTPQEYWRDKFDIVLPYDVTYRQAERILLSAVAQVPDSANIPRKPDVLIGDYLERGTTWRLRYWVPDYSRLAVTRYEIKRNVLRNLYFAGIEVPHTQMDVFSPRWVAAKENEEHEDINFLHGIALLSPLTREELEELGRNMRRHLCVAGQPVVHEGEEGDSLFVVKEGTLEASSTNENGFNTIVGRLNPGNFFGEMSLLTGAPRSANVAPSVDSIVFEITRADLEPLMQKRPDMAAQLSEVLAERQMRNIRLLDGKEVKDPIETQVSLSQQFLSGIQKFFGLGQGGRADSRQPAGSD
ncbi:MAG: mechanosensitive ion channel family protein, partial [Pseudomonadota bacterium]|nr:mechanosensitive ion channel family protein [Pseudomonadota bacterium]